MTNKNKQVPIALDGQEFQLLYNFNALCAIEEASGKGFQQVMQEAGKLTNLRLIIWAGLVSNNPDITIQDVGAMIDPSEIESIMEKVTEAITKASPKPDNPAVPTKKK